MQQDLSGFEGLEGLGGSEGLEGLGGLDGLEDCKGRMDGRTSNTRDAQGGRRIVSSVSTPMNSTSQNSIPKCRHLRFLFFPKQALAVGVLAVLVEGRCWSSTNVKASNCAKLM